MTDDELKNLSGDEDQAAAENGATNGPVSAAPPRIVAEAPLGGKPRPMTPPAQNNQADEFAALDRVLGTVPAADDEDAEGRDMFADIPADEPDTSAHPTDPAGVFAEEKLTLRDEGTESATPGPVTPPPAPRSGLTPEEQIAQRLKALQASESGSIGATSPASSEATSPAPAPAPAAAPAAPASVESVGAAGADDWDDDVSPELASVLFGGRSSAPTAAQPVTAAPVEPAAAPDVKSEPKPEPEPDAVPIELTDIADVRRMLITAEKRSAPAPETALQGKVRYVRVEEPLRDDNGQRSHETWEYLKPDYPGLAGRLVKEVMIEEISYTDGSWLWRYERRYTDRGRDAREVRANPERTYVERTDEVSKLDAESGRRLQFKEDAELIFAAPEKEEKRGLLSGLGSLLGRDDAEDTASAAKVWRQATSSEARQARKQGGEALKRGFLGL